MNIAIVDDMPGELKRISGILEEYSSTNNIHSLKLESFQSAEDFLSGYQPLKYTLIFMDIYMNGMTGVDAVKRIRELDNNTLVVFLTTSPDHTFDAFGVHAYQYLLKAPDDDALKESIFKVLDDVMALRNISNDGITVQVDGQTKSFPFSAIEYAQTDKNYIKIIDCLQNSSRTRMTFSEIRSLLEKDSRFLQINRGLIINMDYIDTFGNGICNLKGGYTLPINVREQKKLDQIRRNYIFSKLHSRQISGGSLS